VIRPKWPRGVRRAGSGYRTPARFSAPTARGIRKGLRNNDLLQPNTSFHTIASASDYLSPQGSIYADTHTHIYTLLVPTLLLCGCLGRERGGLSSLDPTTFDSGGIVVDRSSTISHVFHLKNTGDRQVKMVGVEKSCGCLDATITPQSLAPRQEARLTLSAHVAPSYADRRTVSCVVKTDDPSRGAVTFSLAFHSFPRVQFRPLALDLGSLRRVGTPGESGHREAEAWLDVYRAPGGDADAPRRFDVPDGLLVDTSGKPGTDEPARGIVRTSYPLRVRIRQERLREQPGGRQQLVLGVLTRRGEVGSLPISWAWHESIEASPRRVHFGTLKDITSGPASISVRSTEKRAFRILSVCGDETAAVVPFESPAPAASLIARETHLVALRIRLKNPKRRAAAGTVTVVTDDSTCSQLSIYWSAFVDLSPVKSAQSEP